MTGNRGVVYLAPGQVEVKSIPFPELASPAGRKLGHGVILKVLSTNICGSDQHMVRGRTTAPAGLVLGHEITGEVIETGGDVETLRIGDLVSVPFNVACGRCRCCKEQHTGVCLSVNPARAGGAYGYVDMGGWVGGQAEYVMVPYADFNLLKFPDRDQALAKIRDLTCLSDILPTGYHGAVSAGVGPGSTVYVAGAGPVGLAAAASARLLARRWSSSATSIRRGWPMPAPSALKPRTYRRMRRWASRSPPSWGRRKWIARSTPSVSRRAGTATPVRARRPRPPCSTP
ncbi:alcohol dehydrogenase catalytic domain-containing protein [Chromobacterium haemolyticum]|nr:alcohol dehydrogenase catalytic domain-containing protein [Chromobacterium haemolyticum]